MLKIFNTLTRKKEYFSTIYSKKVDIYVCGVTVYDFCHIGHARTFIFFDCVVRYLRFLGYIVNYVRNITDIDDKIIHRSIKNGESYVQLTNRMITAMHDDFSILNILPPNHEPRVTQYITDIIDFISLLINKNCAYIGSNGDVYFSVENNKEHYNTLSRQNLNKLHVIDYSNINVKRHPMDFALWKKNHNVTKYSVSWESPWGLGRPGWHIECSAISRALLGDRFDIHGGGTDLIFPHHENEIAQSSSINDMPHVNIWMHVGMVMRNNLKMSKSLNNFLTIRDLLKICDPETIRYFLMSTHYRNPFSYTYEKLRQSRLSLEHLYLALQDTDKTINDKKNEYFVRRFIAEINNDFNIPGAYSVLFEMAHTINYLKQKNKKILELRSIAVTLRFLGKILGLLNQDPEIFLKKLNDPNFIKNQNMIQKIESLIKNRNFARESKEWILADQIRHELENLGIRVEDTIDGTTWRFMS